jgi:hypothetical protein
VGVFIKNDIMGRSDISYPPLLLSGIKHMGVERSEGLEKPFFTKFRIALL